MSAELWAGALAGIAGLHLAGRAYQASGAERDRRAYPPPGRMLDGMHICVSGEGSPTVLFEAGLGASSLSWTRLQQQVSRYTRTVSYDRLGLGWSDAPTRPRLMSALVGEIDRAALQAALPQQADHRAGPPLEAHLGEHPLVLGQPREHPCLVDRDPEGLLNVEVEALLQTPEPDVVHVMGRADGPDRSRRYLLNHLPVVGVAAANLVLVGGLDEPLLVEVGDRS